VTVLNDSINLIPHTFQQTPSLLQKHRFNINCSSEKYVINKLQTLNNKQIATVDEASVKYSHTRFMKYLFPHQPFGKKEIYIKELSKNP